MGYQLSEKDIATFLHSLFCTDIGCGFYEEELLVDRWEKPVHKKWLDEALGLGEEVGISDCSELYKRCMEALSMLQVLNDKGKRGAVARYFAKRLCSKF